MSRDIKYIGMDVHKEAIVIAVLDNNEAGDGASDVGPQDRGHCFNTLEKGGTFRRETTETASRLSVAQNAGDRPDSCWVGAPSVLAMLGYEGEYPCTH